MKKSCKRKEIYLIEKTVLTVPNIVSAIEYKVGGKSSHSRKFGSWETSMLLIDGDRIVNFMK